MRSERADKEKDLVLENLADAPRTDSLTPYRPGKGDKVPFDVKRGATYVLAEGRSGARQDPTKVKHAGGLMLSSVWDGSKIPEFQEARRHPTEKTRQRAATNVTSEVRRENRFAHAEVAATTEIGRIGLGLDSEKVSELLLDVPVAVFDHSRGLLDCEVRVPNIMGVLVIRIGATLPRTKRGASRERPGATENVDLDR